MAVNKVIYNNDTLIDITDTTAIASEVIKDKVFYGADGIRTLGTMVEKLSLTFEEGTYMPEEDISRPTINFAEAHPTPPVFLAIYDITDTTEVLAKSNVFMVYYDVYRMWGKPYTPANNTIRYATLFYVNNAGYMQNGNVHFVYSSDNPKASNTQYPRYYVDETSFYPFCNNNTCVWHTGRTYKWIAIWK